MKIGILTINDDNNFGNRLQNYALQSVLSKYGDIYTILNETRISCSNPFLNYLKNIKFKYTVKTNARYKYFKKFNNNITYYSKKINLNSNYTKFNNYFDYYVVGSDQVWNPKLKRFSNLDFLFFSDNNKKKISYAASIGISKLTKKEMIVFKKGLISFNKISVREDRGKEIIEELTGRSDVEVLVDPTMLLTLEEWDEVSNKPRNVNNIKEDKYILNYFLGELSESRKKEIERVAKENNCHIINILDKDDPFYACGPSEFLYLEKNAFLICTDSFHSSVFAIIYNRPFIIFDREQKGVECMNSRLETLIDKFKLKNRKYNGKKITKENLNHDYTEAYKILETERKKSNVFLKKALNIEEKNNEN